MKFIYKTILSAFIILQSTYITGQETEVLTFHDLPDFTELQIQLSTDVIIIKSDKNRMTFQSTPELSSHILIEAQQGRVAISTDIEGYNQPTRLLIETKDLNSIITGGTGSYTIIGLEDESLYVLNPSALVSIKGELKAVWLISTAGHTDMSQLRTKEEFIQTASGASFVKSKATISKLVAERNN